MFFREVLYIIEILLLIDWTTKLVTIGALTKLNMDLFINQSLF